MQGVSVIVVFDPTGERMLLCKRTRQPYQGLCDLVGGKREPSETGLACAYRELYEETGIPGEAIDLSHVLDLTYQLTQWRVQVFAGQLTHAVTLVEEVNPLFWSALDEDFHDQSRYAGEGYIGLVLAYLRAQRFPSGA